MNDKSLRDLMKEKKTSPENMDQNQKAQYEKFKEQVGQYKNKDIPDIMREIDRLKLNKDVLPKLKGKDLDTFANALKPVLSKDQQSKLSELVKYLRNE
jgi:hypothetical protein